MKEHLDIVIKKIRKVQERASKEEEEGWLHLYLKPKLIMLLLQ
jgi:hypothetical protein